MHTVVTTYSLHIRWRDQILNACNQLPVSTPRFFKEVKSIVSSKMEKIWKGQGCGSAFISSGSGSSILGWIPIRIQYGSGSRAFMTKNWENKNYSWKKKKKNFWSKTTIYLSLGLYKERPSYRRSLQLSKEAIQFFNTWTFKQIFYFCGSFLPSWIRIRIPNPDSDPLIRLNPVQSESGSATLEKATFYNYEKNKKDVKYCAPHILSNAAYLS